MNINTCMYVMINIYFIFYCFFSVSFGREILPTVCTCRDWHGGCRRYGESWTDNGIWVYRCDIGATNSTFEGCQITSKSGEVHIIQTGNNETVDGFWVNCERDEIRQKLEIEPKCVVDGEYKRIGETFRKGIFQWICMENGQLVTGCYYRNETGEWNLLKLGEVIVDEGSISYSCDRYRQRPGVVQYHSEIRKDTFRHNSSNKGSNKMVIDFVDKRLKNMPTEWAHQNVPYFIAEMPKNNVHIRYLSASRKTYTTQHDMAHNIFTKNNKIA